MSDSKPPATKKRKLNSRLHLGKGAAHWGVTEQYLRDMHHDYYNYLGRFDVIRGKVQRKGKNLISGKELRAEWAALGLKLHMAGRAKGYKRPATTVVGRATAAAYTHDLVCQIAQETGLSRAAVRARSLRAVLVFNINLHDPDLKTSYDPIEAKLPAQDKEL